MMSEKGKNRKISYVLLTALTSIACFFFVALSVSVPARAGEIEMSSETAVRIAVEEENRMSGSSASDVVSGEIEMPVPAVHSGDLSSAAVSQNDTAIAAGSNTDAAAGTLQTGDDEDLFDAGDDLPAAYSSVALGLVEKPETQGANNCWAHTMTSVAMTSLLKNAPGTLRVNEASFSETQLAEQCYGESVDPLGLTEGDSTYRYGKSAKASAADMGNPMLAAYELMNWRAPIIEGQEGSVFDVASAAATSTAGHARDVRFINVTSDRNIIKKLIMEYGSCAMLTHFAKSGVYGCNSNGARYVPANKDTACQSANHAMTIVGWDDNYSMKNFTYTPENDGAWLVKNSYGTGSGASSGNSEYDSKGYCWISYEDCYFQKESRVFTFVGMDAPDRYDHNYSYDGSHNPAAFLDGVEKAANVFVLGREGAVEELKAVSFGTNEVGGLFDIEIFALPMDGGTGNVWDGTPVSCVRDFSAPYPGLYTVELTDPVRVEGRSRFAIVVTPVHRSGTFSAIIDQTHANNGGFVFTSAARRSDGFVKIDGQVMDVTDAYADEAAAHASNVLRIKAYTKDVAGGGNSDGSGNSGGGSGGSDGDTPGGSDGDTPGGNGTDDSDGGSDGRTSGDGNSSDGRTPAERLPGADMIKDSVTHFAVSAPVMMNGTYVGAAIRVDYTDAVFYIGSKIVPGKLLDANVDLSDITSKFVTRKKYSPDQLLKVSYISSSVNAGKGSFYVKLKLDEKKAGKAGLKKQEIRQIKNLIREVNYASLKDPCVFMITARPLDEGELTIKANWKKNNDGTFALKKVRSVKLRISVNGKSRTLTLKKNRDYTDLKVIDARTGTVSIAGDGNYTGTSLCLAVKNIR